MKKKLLLIATTVALLTVPGKNFGQAPSMGTTSNFALFSTVGALNISGISQLTGDIGTNSGSTTVFVNVNGNIHDQDGASGQCATDLLSLYNDLDAATPTFFIAPALGNGDTLIGGVYYVFGASSLDLDLTLDGLGNPNAVFIFQLEGPLSTGSNSKVHLINGAKACNVFWKVEGLVSMASGSTMRGNIVANNAAINMTAGDTLEGRAFSTAGAITINGSMVYTPTGCGSPILNGPTAPSMGTTECYAIFSSDGPVTNAGITTVTGDVGTNVGLTNGYDPLTVTGMIHPIPDVSTSQCAADLLTMSTYLNSLAADIELRVPAQFGHNLVLTPHTYIMNGAVSLTDTLYLNAEGYTNAVFVIQVFGAFSTSVYSKVILTNGTQAKNVYWQVNGAVNIADYSIFNGTIVANNGAIDLSTGVSVDGRILSTTGAVQTAADTVITPTTCTLIGIVESNSVKTTDAVSIYPNPFSSYTTIVMNKVSASYKAEVKLYNILGAEVMSTPIIKKSTTIDTINLPEGIYFYQITDNNKMIQSGRLIAE
ncbi:MAG: ice-binding family protein [Bacteroidota bacterium]|nr:ice-binding family protein [Bacteroidota bacterium]